MVSVTDWKRYEQLCVEIEKHPCLYDPSSKNYKCFKMRPVIYRQIAENLGNDWNGDLVKEWFTKIQARRSREKKRFSLRRSGDGVEDCPPSSDWPLWEITYFLDTDRPRQTQSGGVTHTSTEELALADDCATPKMPNKKAKKLDEDRPFILTQKEAQNLMAGEKEQKDAAANFGELVANKLRQYNDDDQEELMHDIIGLFMAKRRRLNDANVRGKNYLNFLKIRIKILYLGSVVSYSISINKE